MRSSSSFGFVAFCLASACAMALTGCRGSQPATAGGLTPIRLQLDWYPQPEHGGFFAAQLLGYYKAEGLDVTLLPLPQYGSVAQLVASGKADIGLGSSDQILEWNSNGLPLVAVSATMQHDPQAIMIHKDSPIHDFTVTFVDRDHPIVRGLKPSFAQSQDELYASMQMQPAGGYHVLATAWDDHSLYNGKFKTPLTGPGANEPLLWTVQYGNGRVFATMIGHSAQATRSPGFRVTFTRGVEWAATGGVTQIPPADMADPEAR